MKRDVVLEDRSVDEWMDRERRRDRGDGGMGMLGLQGGEGEME